MLSREGSCPLEHEGCLCELDVVFVGVKVQVEVARDYFPLRQAVFEQAEHGLVVVLDFEFLLAVLMGDFVQVDELSVEQAHVGWSKSHRDPVLLVKLRTFVMDELKAKTCKLRSVEVLHPVHLLEADNRGA